MADLLDKIIEAKEKIGDEAALIVANHLNIENFSEQKLKGSCPFGHSDSTPSFIWDKEQKSYHCFSKETNIITRDGIKSIIDIVDEPVEIVNGNGEWECVTFKNFGKQRLMKLTLTSNFKEKVIFATPEHEWIVQKYKKKIKTKDLKQNFRLERMWLKSHKDIKIDAEGVRHGFIYGDGHISKKNKNTYSHQVFLYDKNKFEFANEYFKVVKNKSTESRGAFGYINYVSPINYKEIPDYNKGIEYLFGFLAGYFVADGNCSGNSVQISSSKYDDLVKIKHIFTIVGIPTYPICETIRNENSNGGIIEYKKEYPLYTLRIVSSAIPSNFYISNKKRIKKSEYKSYLGYKVVSVENTDRYEDVYCCVTSTHSFVLEDFILTGNCFSCGKNYSILDMYVDIEGSYLKALKRLFSETDIEFNTKEIKQNREEYFKDYVYPEEEKNTDRSKVEGYFNKRGISIKTLDYAGIKQDKYGNIVFEFRDLDDTLLCIKYRKAGKVKKKEPKMWYQKDKSNCPILYNINKVDITKPLLIIEGEIDALSCIEAGFTNVVSIPHGASDTTWIEFNYDFLEQFEEIIVWFDNDKAGQLATNNTVSRLGEYRCKLIKPEKEYEDAVEKYYKTYDENVVIRKTDANNILLACGRSDMLKLINSAEEIPSKRLKYLMDCEMVDVKDMEKVTTGFKSLDRILYGNLFPCFSIITGYTGCVDADTEFFNGKQWKRIADYQYGDKVLQYNKDGTTELVNPVQYHKYPSEYLYHFKTKYGIDQCLSDEHNVYYIGHQDETLRHKTFKEIRELHNNSKNGFSGRFITSFKYSGKGIDLTDEQIKLMCAIICDGSFYSNIAHNKNAKSYLTCRFHIKKQRKKDKLIELFDECGLEYRKVVSSSEGYTDFYIQAPMREKEFTEYWYNCSQHQLQIICDNVLFWDGHKDNVRKSFSTSNKKTADFIQFAFSSCGYRATISINNRVGLKKSNGYVYKNIEYSVIISDRKYIGLYTNGEKVKINQYKTTDGFKYCFTTNSGMWVMRRNNRIVISGNSGKSSLANIMSVIAPVENEYKTFIFSGELAEGQLLNWIVSPLAGYNHTIEWTNSENGSKGYSVTKEAESKIREYYRKNIILYSDTDELDTSGETILNEMENAYKRYGCKVFLIDNLMCINFEDLSDSENKWSSQKQFIIKLMKFTNKYGVNVNLILHPRKPNQAQSQTAYDLHGASEIGNLCHRLLWINRLKDDPAGFNIEIKIVKDRPTGKGNESCKMNYDSKTHRIYSDRTEQRFAYKWEEEAKIKYNDFINQRLICNLPDDDPNPQMYCDQM